MEDRRAFISLRDREFIHKNEGKLGLGETEAKKVYAMTVALGVDNPKEMSKKRDGYVKAETIDTYTEVIIATARLGADDITDENINQFADHNECISFADKCSYAGFEKLAQMMEEANGDEDILISELMKELDRLYEKNVKPEENLQIC